MSECAGLSANLLFALLHWHKAGFFMDLKLEDELLGNDCTYGIYFCSLSFHNLLNRKQLLFRENTLCRR